jgi:hypothetical protein
MLPFHCFLSDVTRSSRSDAAHQFSFKLVQTVMNDDAASDQGLLARNGASQPVMPSGYLCGPRAAVQQGVKSGKK